MCPATNISLVAQNRLLLQALTRILRKRREFRVIQAAPFSPDTIAKIAESGCDILVIDSTVTGDFGFQLVQAALDSVVGLKVLLIGMEEDEDSFLKAVSTGAAGYVLKDASALDVVAAIRAVIQEEAVCPPRLCLSLFKYVARTQTRLPNLRTKVQLGLTRRQQQLVPMLAQGLTNKEIASELNISEQTVKNHVHRMLQKVGAEDRLEVVEIVKVNQVFL